MVSGETRSTFIKRGKKTHARQFLVRFLALLVANRGLKRHDRECRHFQLSRPASLQTSSVKTNSNAVLLLVIRVEAAPNQSDSHRHEPCCTCWTCPSHWTTAQPCGPLAARGYRETGYMFCLCVLFFLQIRTPRRTATVIHSLPTKSNGSCVLQNSFHSR